ncbi:MAG: DUF1211 domain-containing protein [Methanomicrobiaceae archaeon]|nr:DUF1211 domain-containing protein [Methanomicrobiaceae archaeon]
MRKIMELGKNRIEALTDGVYAIALTLGVLSIDISELPAASSQGALYNSLDVILPQVFYYAIAFFVLISFWMAHHRMMDYVSRVDNIFNWMNVVALFFVALVPFTTDLMGYYDDYPLAITLYAANLMIIGVLLTSSWNYISSKKELMRADTTPEIILRFKIRGISCPLVAFIVIIYSNLISTEHATAFFMLIPVVSIIIERILADKIAKMTKMQLKMNLKK